MSDANTRSGSTLRRTAIHSSMRGYMAWKVSAVVRGSFGGEPPPAKLQHPAIQFVEDLVEPRLHREIQTHVPAGNREAKRRLISGPEQFEHVERGVMTAGLDVADDLLEFFDRGRWHQELVLREAG